MVVKIVGTGVKEKKKKKTNTISGLLAELEIPGSKVRNTLKIAVVRVSALVGTGSLGPNSYRLTCRDPGDACTRTVG